jgi:hypothetical protein
VLVHECADPLLQSPASLAVLEIHDAPDLAGGTRRLPVTISSDWSVDKVFGRCDGGCT